MDVETDITPRDSTGVPTWRLVFIGISLCIGLFLSLLDTTIIATALYTIGQDLHAEQIVNWVALAYTLSYLSFCVIISRLADIVGRRNAWLASLVLFFGFSIGCGFSQSLNSLIACRVLQGIGGSGLYSITFVIMTELSPPSLSGILGGVVGAVIACAGVLGPVLGGIITHYTTWKWIFWINAPIGIVPFVMFLIAWPKPHLLPPLRKRSIKDFDFVGSSLVIAASVLVVFPFQEAGEKADIWKTALFICPLVIGCICWCLLLGWEVLVARFRKEDFASMFPLRLVNNRVYMAYVFVALFMGFPYFMTVYALPLRFQVVNGKTPLVAGVSLLPMLGAVAVGSMLGGALNSKKDHFFQVILVGSCLMVLGTGLLSTLSNTVRVEPKTYGFQVLIGMGFGLTIATASLGGSLEVDAKDNTVGQGIIAQLRVLGGSIGIAASTTILGVTQRRQLLRPGIVTEDELINLQTAARQFSPSQLHAVSRAYSDAFNEDMRICAIVSGLCVLATLLAFKRNPLSVTERKAELQAAERKRLRDLEPRQYETAANSETVSVA